MSGSVEFFGREGTGPLTVHLIGRRATFPTLSTATQDADEWYAGIISGVVVQVGLLDLQ